MVGEHIMAKYQKELDRNILMGKNIPKTICGICLGKSTDQ